MNIKLTFTMIFVCLVLLLVFFYIDLESNIIILLGVVIILLINNIIMNKEYFESNEHQSKIQYNSSCLKKNVFVDSNRKCN
jgi:ABC-type transport system involved in cytochrome bd biosynthesis fused ATPase/permease subunit